MPLADSPLLVVYVKTPDLHIKVFWGVEYMMFSFLSRPTPKDGKVLVFTRDLWQGKIPINVEINPGWSKVYTEDVLSLEDLTQALAWTAPGTPRIPEKTATYEMIASPRISIALLNLIHPLLCYLFLSPTSA